MLGTLFHWFKIGLVVTVAIVVISLFMKNPAAWGQNVGGFFTAIQTFLNNVINSSPLG